MQPGNCFSEGSRWLKADFHLHTRADKEFVYSKEDDRFIQDYVTALQQAEIGIGVITNHNKFDLKEFKALKKKARKADIFLLPGVELSVKEGANGVHMLVVFSDEWIADGKDYINPFLASQFTGKTSDEYEHENGRSNHDILTTLNSLESCHKRFFVVFAHVEQKSGLWKEVGGGLFSELGQKPLFRQYTLGFQKVRSHDKSDKPCRTKVKDWLKDAYPAEVEGCDAKSTEQLGKGQASYLKLGSFDFDAVRLALMDHQDRVAAEAPRSTHSHVCAVRFEGGLMDKQSFHLSSGLNCFIGIRGSGKSSLLEAIRYALNLPFGPKAQDTRYKEALMAHLLGSGGKVVVEAIDQHGQIYQIHRVLNQLPDVYLNGNLLPGVSITSTVLHEPLYFGQKDLSATDEGFETGLVEKLVGQQLSDVRTRIETQRRQVIQVIEQLQDLNDSEEKEQAYAERLKDVQYKLDFFKKHGVENKLQEQVEFNRDIRKCESIDALIQSWIQALNNLLAQFEDDLRNQLRHQSKCNQPFFIKYFEIYQNIISGIDTVKSVIQQTEEQNKTLVNHYHQLLTKRDSLKESFAQIERELASSMQAEGQTNIRPDEFVKLSKEKDRLQQMVDAARKQGKQEEIITDKLLKQLVELNKLWREEFQLIQKTLDRINKGQSALEIHATFKGDKSAMLGYIKQLFRGSKLRESAYEKICKDYSDFGDIYRQIDDITLSASNAEKFRHYFMLNLEALLTWQVPNHFTVNYHGKPLQDHSLGQRASAMILFILSRQDNDLVIIDQPEDDLDNQTIYEDVIKLIRQVKSGLQFIFATHNANFPVLGDAEQVISCEYTADRIHINTGSIDCPQLQKDIVNIMEGGEEAFNRRNEIYQLWKP